MPREVSGVKRGQMSQERLVVLRESVVLREVSGAKRGQWCQERPVVLREVSGAKRGQIRAKVG